MQPIVNVGGNGRSVRFKGNAIVEHLLEWSGTRGLGLNELACMKFSQSDWEQFAQLIGYSLIGYHELSYVSDGSALEASRIAKELGFGEVGCRCGEGCEIHSGVEKETE